MDDALKTWGIHSLIFLPAFPLGEGGGTASLGGLEITHSQYQSPIVLLAPHKDGNKQGWRCCHSTRYLNDLWIG